MESIFPFTKSLEANCHLRSFSSLAKCFSLSSFNSLMSPRGFASDQNPLPRLITTPSPAITMTHWLVFEPPPPVLRDAMSRNPLCPIPHSLLIRWRRRLAIFHHQHDCGHGYPHCGNSDSGGGKSHWYKIFHHATNINLPVR